MYKCICGAVFEEPLKITEVNRHGDGYFEHMTMWVCPYCTGGHYDEYDEEEDEE